MVVSAKMETKRNRTPSFDRAFLDEGNPLIKWLVSFW